MAIGADQQTTSEMIRVILVEDHLLTRMNLAAILKKAPNIQLVAEAEDGPKAIELTGEHKPDIVLMDVGLPIMDGIEAAAAIRKQFPDVKIMMLTAADRDSDVFAALAAGAGGYCLKNMEADRLYRAITSVNDGDLWLDSGIASKVLKQYSPLSPAEAKSGDGAPVYGDGAGSGEKAQMSDLTDPLSPREMEVLNLLVGGFSNQQIADNLVISLATAKTHVRNILNKLAVDDRTQAAVHAMRRGLV